jgi:hypothetical protein
MSKNRTVIGIDPGLQGAFVLLGPSTFDFKLMPIKNKNEIDFEKVCDIMTSWSLRADHVFLERAVPLAMGSKAAFNYGRGFAALEIACAACGVPTTYVEPGKWTKEVHAGINADLKPKAKSLIALERLHGGLKSKVPTLRTGKMHGGVIDALLIAGFGLR